MTPPSPRSSSAGSNAFYIRRTAHPCCAARRHTCAAKFPPGAVLALRLACVLFAVYSHSLAGYFHSDRSRLCVSYLPKGSSHPDSHLTYFGVHAEPLKDKTLNEWVSKGVLPTGTFAGGRLARFGTHYSVLSLALMLTDRPRPVASCLRSPFE